MRASMGARSSGWLARLIANVLDGPTPAETRAPDETLPPTVQPPPAGDAGGEGPAHEPALPSRRAREDPEYAAVAEESRGGEPMVMSCRHCGGRSLPARLRLGRPLLGVWTPRRFMRGMRWCSSRAPPGVGAVGWPPMQARRLGQASGPPAGPRGQSGRALMPRPSAMASAAWRSRRGVEQVLVQGRRRSADLDPRRRRRGRGRGRGPGPPGGGASFRAALRTQGGGQRIRRHRGGPCSSPIAGQLRTA